jgi:hypothetical protein
VTLVSVSLGIVVLPLAYLFAVTRRDPPALGNPLVEFLEDFFDPLTWL